MNIIRQKSIEIFDSTYDTIAYHLANNRNICWIVGLAMVVLSLWMRSGMYLGTDPAFYYLTAERILQGERYYYDFFEPNFPINFYIFSIPVILHNITGIAPVTSFYIFVTLVALTSIYFSSLILKKTSVYQDGVFYNFLIMAIFIGHFFPICTFSGNLIGTKTLLFLSFVLPYFCSFFWEADNKKIPTNIAIIIGIFAGLTVCLKPHYVIFPIVMELYLIIKHRSLRYSFRPMNYAIIAVNLLHISWLLAFVPEYLSKLAPILMVSYHGIRNEFFLTSIKWTIVEQLFIIIIILFSKSPKSSARTILLYGLIATGIIFGLEGLYSGDQQTILYFFDGMLLAKIVLDLVRHKPKIHFFSKILLTIAFTGMLVNVLTEIYPEGSDFNMLAIEHIIDKNEELQNTGPIVILSRHNFIPVSFYLNNKVHHNIFTLSFLYGALYTKDVSSHQPNSYKHKLASEAVDYITNLQIRQINEFKPSVIFIENNTSTLHSQCFIQFIEFFLMNDEFRKAFSNYEFHSRIRELDPKAPPKDVNMIVGDISVYIRKEPGDNKPKPPLKFQGIFF